MKQMKKKTAIIFAAILSICTIFASNALALDETVGTVQQGVWVNPDSITFSLDVAGPCGETGFVLLNSNPIFWQVYTALLVARSESTVVDVVSSSCYSGNSQFTVVQWMKLGN